MNVTATRTGWKRYSTRCSRCPSDLLPSGVGKRRRWMRRPRDRSRSRARLAGHRRSLPTCQYSAMSSLIHAGCLTGVRGWNSMTCGLMSRTGEASMASRPRTVIVRSVTSTSSHVVRPSRLGRALARRAKIPTSGQSGRFLGWRDPRLILARRGVAPAGALRPTPPR